MTYASLTFDGTSSVLKFQVTIANLSFHMIEPDRLAAYLAARSILALVPGPGILYVMTRTIADGTREGVLSALAFQALQYAGAAYLYLGIQMVRRSGHLEVADAPQPKGNPFAQGTVTEGLNPKTAIFFLSFIPQFVTQPTFAQFFVLGARPPRPQTNRHLASPPATRYWHRHDYPGNLCRG